MGTNDYSLPVEAVMADEIARVRPWPLRAADRRELFAEWCRKNPDVLRELELTALSIDAHGLRVSTKYLIERQRYEGRYKAVGVPFTDYQGTVRVYSINNSDSSLMARWLLARHPGMNLETRRSMYDGEVPNA
ncbi:hypothetical protein [Collinsella ihumii]|uniref:Uncharacterized protein n=1 Tax=Collinsella ihumii TaxID=1720204 RepID=A0ABT7XFP0_9ACTN|nr:hypothetical protein [Collinsella ihumii]MDN0055654.1 hypothetical protein [Collinsella ihumii]MDN0064236.1 hypothetical protein [Collinsella ihumii]